MYNCKYCGAKVEDGKVCTCVSAQQNEALKAAGLELGKIFREVQAGSLNRDDDDEVTAEDFEEELPKSNAQEEFVEAAEEADDDEVEPGKSVRAQFEEQTEDFGKLGEAAAEVNKEVEETSSDSIKNSGSFEHLEEEKHKILEEPITAEEKARRILIQAAAEEAAAQESARQAQLKAAADLAAAKVAVEEANRQAMALVKAEENARQVAIQSATTQAVVQAEEAMRLASQAQAAAVAAEEAALHAQERSRRPRKGIIEIGTVRQGMKDLGKVLISPGKGIGRYVVSDSLWASLIAIGLQAILNGIMGAILSMKFNQLVSDSINGVITGIGSLFNKQLQPGVAVTFFNQRAVMASTFAYSVLLAVVFAFFMFIVAKIAREDSINIMRSLNIPAAKAMLMSPILVLCVVATYFVPMLGVICYWFFEYMVFIICICHIFDECPKITQNKRVFLVPLIIIIVGILSFIVIAFSIRSFIPESIRGTSELVNNIIGMFRK